MTVGHSLLELGRAEELRAVQKDHVEGDALAQLPQLGDKVRLGELLLSGPPLLPLGRVCAGQAAAVQDLLDRGDGAGFHGRAQDCLHGEVAQSVAGLG